MSSPFEYEDDEPGCDSGCGRCCTSCWAFRPPPLRVLLIPWLLAVILGAAAFVIFRFDVGGFCPARSVNSTFASDCDEAIVLGNVSASNWGLFILIVTVAYALIGLITSLVWWAMRSCAGHKSLMWRYLRDLRTPTHYIVWDVIFFFVFNFFVVDAEPAIYDVCRVVGVVVIVFAVCYILAKICTVAAIEKLHSSVKKLMKQLKAQWNLILKLTKMDTDSFKIGSLISSLNPLSKDGEEAQEDDVNVEMQTAATDGLDEPAIKKLFADIDVKGRGYFGMKELAAFLGDEKTARKVWAVFNTNEKRLYANEFRNTIVSIQNKAKRVAQDITSREFLGDIIHNVIFGFFVVLGVFFVFILFGVPVGDLLTGLGVIAMALGFTFGGSLGTMFNNFVWLLTSHAYGVGDWISLGDEQFSVSEITLANTYGYLDDGHLVVIPNSTASGARIYNWTRSAYTCVILFPEISAGTPKEKLEALKTAINDYFKANPKAWRHDVINNWFEIVDVVNTRNALKLQIRCFIRGTNWGAFDTHEPIKNDLLNYIRATAGKLQIGYHPGTSPVRMMDDAPPHNNPLPAAGSADQPEQDSAVEPAPTSPSSGSPEDDSSSSSSEEVVAKKSKSKKSKKSKK